MWKFAKNNGISETFRRKMKLIRRLVYGYKNFKNYKLRLLAQYGIFGNPADFGIEPRRNMQKKRNPADCVFSKCGADEVRTHDL